MYIPVVLTTTNLHTKSFHVVTIIGTLKSTSYKNVNLSLLGSRMYIQKYVYVITYRHMHDQKHYMPLASSMAGA